MASISVTQHSAIGGRQGAQLSALEMNFAYYCVPTFTSSRFLIKAQPPTRTNLSGHGMHLIKTYKALVFPRGICVKKCLPDQKRAERSHFFTTSKTT